jgi:hypothetical protein
MNAEQYLTACGWQRVDQSMGPSGWEHPGDPGRVLDLASALIEQGNRPPPARSVRMSVSGYRPDPTQWERDHG